MDYKEDMNLQYIEKLDLQTEEVKEVEFLEKHTIINSEPFTVNKYNGHTRDFLPIGGEYDDGFKSVNETVELGNIIYNGNATTSFYNSGNNNVSIKDDNSVELF